ncbi:response regulator [Streptomyces sp. NP160]|uniref:response regulator n=1 Tax=Streptomyces sp. NP160 TaxID=2586637 RepID=UPI001118BC20|nr:response regulator [Streptomyces sp. NP160]TNM67735.1 response regulator [Streptomyces sp. NP160]
MTAPAGGAGRSPRDVRVLVVEDEPLVASAHAQYVRELARFELAGAAGTVREAVAQLKAAAAAGRPVDLVLLDLDLPDGHGLDLVRSLRAARWTGDVIAVTSTRDLAAVRSAVSLGVVQYLLKPFARRSFEDKLTRYLDYRAQLAADGGGPLGQDDVDRAFAALRTPGEASTALPSGLVAETVDAVRRAVAAAPSSASEVAASCGTSRVTARRYLEHLTEVGELERHQRYGGTGRPEVEYRPARRGR